MSLEVKQAIAFLSVLAAVSAVSSTGHAQFYPAKPIRMIVPWNLAARPTRSHASSGRR